MSGRNRTTRKEKAYAHHLDLSEREKSQLDIEMNRTVVIYVIKDTRGGITFRICYDNIYRGRDALYIVISK